MEKRHLRNLLLGGALATGLGVATERGCDKEDTPPPESKTERIHKPEKKDETGPKLVVRDTREKIETATTAQIIGDEHEQPTNIESTESNVISSAKIAFPDATIIREGNTLKKILELPHGSLFFQENNDVVSELRVYLGDYEMEDGSKFPNAKSLFRVTKDENGHYEVANFETPIDALVSTDAAGLPNVLKEVRELQELQLGISSGRIKYEELLRKQKPTFNDLLQLKQYYELAIHDFEDLKQRTW